MFSDAACTLTKHDASVGAIELWTVDVFCTAEGAATLLLGGFRTVSEVRGGFVSFGVLLRKLFAAESIAVLVVVAFLEMVCPGGQGTC